MAKGYTEEQARKNYPLAFAYFGELAQEVAKKAGAKGTENAAIKADSILSSLHHIGEAEQRLDEIEKATRDPKGGRATPTAQQQNFVSQTIASYEVWNKELKGNIKTFLGNDFKGAAEEVMGRLDHLRGNATRNMKTILGEGLYNHQVALNQANKIAYGLYGNQQAADGSSLANNASVEIAEGLEKEGKIPEKYATLLKEYEARKPSGSMPTGKGVTPTPTNIANR